MANFYMIMAALFGILGAISLYLYRHHSAKHRAEIDAVAQDDREEIKTKIDSSVEKITKSINDESDKSDEQQDLLLKEIDRIHAVSESEIKKAINESKEEIKKEKQSAGIDPYIRLASNGIYIVSEEDKNFEEKGYDKNFRYYRAKFDRNEAIASNLKIETYILFEFIDQDGIEHELHSIELFNVMDEFPVGTLDAPLGQSLKRLIDKKFYVYFNGSYTNFSGTQTYSIDKLYEYNPETKKTIMPIANRDKIIEIITKLKG